MSRFKMYVTVGFGCMMFALLLAAAPKTPWQIEVQTAKTRITIDPATGNQNELKKPPLDGAISPDGKRIAYVKTIQRGESYSRELCVAPLNPDGSRGAERKMTSGAETAYDPQWMPDSKNVVYVRGTGKFQQVYITNVDQEKRSETRVSGGGAASFQPRISKDGRISCLIVRDEKPKQRLVDLVVMQDGKTKTIVERQWISDTAWSPDGKRIAYSTIGELIVIDVDSRKRTTRDFKSIDERLYSHAAGALAWHPDGQSIATAITFVGGRATVGGSEPEPMLGDREVFVVPLQGKVMWFTAPAAPLKIRWVNGRD